MTSEERIVEGGTRYKRKEKEKETVRGKEEEKKEEEEQKEECFNLSLISIVHMKQGQVLQISRI